MIHFTIEDVADYYYQEWISATMNGQMTKKGVYKTKQFYFLETQFVISKASCLQY